MTPVLSNILLQLTHADPALSNEHIYAKVIQADPDNDGCVTLRFTSVPSPICDYFKSLECWTGKRSYRGQERGTERVVFILMSMSANLPWQHLLGFFPLRGEKDRFDWVGEGLAPNGL